MALIKDTDSTGALTVQLTKIVSDAKYIDPSNAMGVWPPLNQDGSTPYGQPYVHLFYVDKNSHAQWYRMDPSVSQSTWVHVQDFGFMTGIIIYRGIVTMWNALFSRSYNFYGGSEVTYPDGSGGPTSSGAPAGGSSLFANQPFHHGGESFFASYDAAVVGSNAGYNPAISKAFGCYLFNYYEAGGLYGTSYLMTPPGPFIVGNPTASAPSPQFDAFFTPEVYDNLPAITGIISTLYAADDTLIHGPEPVVVTAPSVNYPPPNPITGLSGTPSLVANVKVLQPQQYDANGNITTDPMFSVAYNQGSNFKTFTDFAGASGGSGGNSYVGYFGGYTLGGISTRGAFHPGYNVSGDYAISKGAPEVWDEGLLTPETCVASGLYNGVIFVQGIDSAGLLASNYLGSTISGAAEIQNDGTRTRFGKCRILGSTGISGITHAFAPPIQPLSGSLSSFGFWQGAYDGTVNNGNIYWVTDSQPFQHDTYGRIVPLAQAPIDPPLVFTYQDIPLPPTISPLGVASSDNNLPHYNVQQLTDAAANPNILPNPNNSPGISPVLRALFSMSGLPFSVTRELFNDGGPHQAGNALDLAGPTPPLTGDGLALDDVADQEVVDLSAYIKSIPELFDVAIRVNASNDAESVYVMNGQVVTKSAFSSSLQVDTQRGIHVVSSSSRIRTALQSPGVLAALGVGPAIDTLVNGKIVVRSMFQLGQFGARYVYVNNDQLQSVGKGIKGLAVGKDNPKIVHFW